MSSKKKELTSKKLAVLQIIEEEETVLFAPFSSQITHEIKVASWEKVLQRAKSVGLVTEQRDWKFVRDKVYSVWKSRTMSKRDNARATRSAGGSDKIFDEIDLKILDIIDKESPILDGLGLPETGDINAGESTSIVEDMQMPSTSKTNTSDENKRSAGVILERRGSKRHSEKQHNIGASGVQSEKDQLLIELLKAEVYVRRLQALKLEKELGLQRSDVTTCLPPTAGEEKNIETEDIVMENEENGEQVDSETTCNESQTIHNPDGGFVNTGQLFLNIDSDENVFLLPDKKIE